MASEERHPYPLYNTTFTLHRLSPLYTARDSPLDNASLQQYSRSFRNILAGDVLRGVRVGLGSDEDVLARVGALQTVTWRLLPEEDLWATEEDAQLDATIDLSDSRGIFVTIVYETATYSAILLEEENPGEAMGGSEFQHFPLLLTRMPGSLRETFVDFLAGTFDTRVSALNLGRSYMTKALEDYILDCSMGEESEPDDLAQISRVLRSVIKDVQVVIGFDFPGSPSLKTIDMVIARDDLPRIIQSGRRIERQEGGHESPFMAALGNHVNAHLALNMRHERVKFLKVACGAFVLGAEGKAKFTEPAVHGGDGIQNQATWGLINGLVRLAKGGGMSKVQEG